MCQIDNVNTQYTYLCRLLHILKINALFGGTQLTQNLRAGTKYGLKDWDWASPEFAKSLPTAVWCKGLSELNWAILESFNIFCKLCPISYI